MIRTEEEIQALKDSWARDPNWDIEDTEGFEEHRDELFQFRMKREAEWQEKEIARVEARTAKFFSETGIHDPLISESLSTFTEIENDLVRVTHYSDSFSLEATAQLETAQAQVRAMLLMAAQFKRVGDLFQELLDQTEASDNTEFMTNLYKAD
jgi:hypothetical protein